MKRALVHIVILLLVFSLGLALVGCTPQDPSEDTPSAPPVDVQDLAVPELSAGERAATRLQQRENGLMADGFRVPGLPPPEEAP